jgi:hypothetical protein
MARPFVAIGLFAATIGYSIGLDPGVFRNVAAALMITVGVVLLVTRFQERLVLAGAPLANWRGFIRYLVAICIGVAATLAWQSYGEAAKQIIATRAPEMGWSPDSKSARRWCPSRAPSLLFGSRPLYPKTLNRRKDQSSTNCATSPIPTEDNKVVPLWVL